MELGLGLADVTHKDWLVARTGGTGKGVDAYFELFFQKAQQITKAKGVRWSTTNVESLAANLSLMVPSGLISTGQIPDVENIPGLPAITIQSDWSLQ